MATATEDALQMERSAILKSQETPSPGHLPSGADPSILRFGREDATMEIRTAVITAVKNLYYTKANGDVICSASLSDLLSSVERVATSSTSNEVQPWWLDARNASRQEVEDVCKMFRIHPLVWEDVATRDRQEKMQVLDRYYFLSLQSFMTAYDTDKENLDVVNLYLLVFGTGILSISCGDARLQERVRDRIDRRMASGKSLFSANWICYAMIDELVEDIAGRVRHIRSETDFIEDSIPVAHFADLQAIRARVHDCHKRINACTSILAGKSDVIHELAKEGNGSFADAVVNRVIMLNGRGQCLHDVDEHIHATLAELKNLERNIRDSHSLLLSQIKTLQFDREQKLRKLLLWLNYLLVIFLLLNIIPSLFTVNIPFPGENTKGLGWFFGIAGVMVSIGVGFILFAKLLGIFRYDGDSFSQTV